MPLFNAIAAMSENRVIGDHGKIPWHLPEDFRWFKYKTMGGTLIMGRKTFESIGKPLPGRKTIVISQFAKPANVEACSDFTELALRNTDELFWLCGGAQIYEQYLGFCSYLYLTRVVGQFDGDIYFPPFEDSFILEQTIHQTPEFQVERWINRAHLDGRQDQAGLPLESWPFLERRN